MGFIKDAWEIGVSNIKDAAHSVGQGLDQLWNKICNVLSSLTGGQIGPSLRTSSYVTPKQITDLLDQVLKDKSIRLSNRQKLIDSLTDELQAYDDSIGSSTFRSYISRLKRDAQKRVNEEQRKLTRDEAYADRTISKIESANAETHQSTRNSLFDSAKEMASKIANYEKPIKEED